MGDRDEIDELIREAHAEARASVKSLLRERFERMLLEGAEERLAPRPAEPAPRPAEAPRAAPQARESGEGWWLYAVTSAEISELDDMPAGVAAGNSPEVVRAGSLRAIASRVPLDEFGSDGLRRNLNDIAWLETTVRAHEAVIEAALTAAAVVPMRVCTIYRSREHVRAAVAEREAQFADALRWLAGRAEWGVKMLALRDLIEDHVRARSADAPAAGDGDGGSYLARKQRDRQVRGEADMIVDEAVRESHARLEEWATASQLLAAQNKELSGHEGDMVMNGAYLVDDDRAEAFAGVVRELERQYGHAGFAFELTGPWPAYHFAAGLEPSGEPVA